MFGGSVIGGGACAYCFVLLLFWASCKALKARPLASILPASNELGYSNLILGDFTSGGFLNGSTAWQV